MKKRNGASFLKTLWSFAIPLLLLMFFISGTAYPQEKFINITVKNGLPSNRTASCLKDKKGFLWFATDNGIARYDGINFKVFAPGTRNNYALEEKVFQYLYQFNDDEILFISYEGSLYSYKYSTGRFINLSKTNSSLAGVYILNLHRDKKGNFWFATGRGILKTDSGFRLIKEYIIEDSEKGTPGNQVLSISEDRKGILWLGMLARCVMLFDPVREKFSNKEFSGKLPRLQQVKSIIIPANSDFAYVATGGAGLYRININDFSVKSWRYVPGVKNSLPSDRIVNLALQGDSVLWAGTLDGLAKINLQTGTINSFFNSQNHPYSLINNVVNNLYIDDQNILWVLTFGGISKLYLFPERFIKDSQDPSNIHSLISNKVGHTIQDKKGNLWAATSKGISVKDNNTGKYFHYTLPLSFPGHSNQEIVYFFVEGNTWWIGTWGGGLSRFTYPENFRPGDKLKFSNFYFNPSDSKSLSSNFVRAITKDLPGNLWITTWNGGLNKIPAGEKNKDRISFVRYTHSSGNNGVASNYLSEIQADEKGNLWISTSVGLQRFNPSSGSSELFVPDPANKEDLINSSICVIIDRNRDVLLGTFGGLVKIKNRDGKYIPEIIYRNPDRGIYSIIEDENGTCWFSTTNSEIGVYFPETGRIKLYYMIEETGGFDFYFGAPSRLKDGRFCFGGNSGILFFKPVSLMGKSSPPEVYFTSINTNGEEVSLPTDVSEVKEITLGYNERNLIVRFAGLNYVYPEKNEYRYMLEGMSGGWIDLGNRGEINFAGLKAGNYTLRIAASNNYGVWSGREARLHISVIPPLWENTYVRIAGLVLIALIVYIYVRRKIGEYQKEKMRQNEFSRLLIESQERERKRISGELHDGLGQNLLVIKNQLEFFRQKTGQDNQELDSINDLIKESINEVKGLSSDLHPHQLERLGLVKALKGMINKVSSTFPLEINTDIDDIDPCFGKEQGINIYRIIQESLNNIIKHSGAGKVFLSLKKSGAQISIIIEDNGKGFDTGDLNIKQKFDEGLGLKSIAERVRLIGGNYSITSTPGKGTKITITAECKDEKEN